MADLRHHCSFELTAGGQSHQVEVWCLIDPGERGNYNGHPDDRFPADPARVIDWCAVHVDGWPVHPGDDWSNLTAHWLFRHRPEIEGNVLADWRAQPEETSE